MSAGEIIIGLVIIVFFIAAGLMSMMKPPGDDEVESPLDDHLHDAEDPTAP